MEKGQKGEGVKDYPDDYGLPRRMLELKLI